MVLTNDFMTKLANLLEKMGETEPEQLDPTQVELIPNTLAELDVKVPFFQENIIYSEASDDLSVLKEKKQAMEPKDMIQEAHPNPVYVSNALGDGGLVENQNEQQQKIIQMINKRPTGNLVHIYAEAVHELAK